MSLHGGDIYMENKIISLDAYELQKYEPNRFPFLYIDRVLECVPGKYARGYKNFTNNEWFFPIHYEGHPFVPAAIQTETLSQMATIPFTTLPGIEQVDVVGSEWRAKFHREIVPGDRLDIEAEVISWNRGVGKAKAKSWVDGKLACEVEVTLVVPSIFNKYRIKKETKNE